MTALAWDQVGDRVYETGIDKGVLYLPDGSAVPWNGLKSVNESPNREVTSVHYDGKKINDLVTLGDFSATMKALTYPNEFQEVEGLGVTGAGIAFDNQRPKLFAFCYRNRVGNDVDGETAGYKIHIVLNVTAVPKEVERSTVEDELEPVEFEWELFAIAEELPSLGPTAHVIIDTRTVDPWLVEEIEEALYGSEEADAGLIPMTELAAYLAEWARVRIIDNGDGTWTAIEARPLFISVLEADVSFQIEDVDATYLDADTYTIRDTFAPFGGP